MHQDLKTASGADNEYDNFLSCGQVKRALPENESEREKRQTDRNNVGVLVQELQHGFPPVAAQVLIPDPRVAFKRKSWVDQSLIVVAFVNRAV